MVNQDCKKMNLYQGLKALAESSFPKKCTNCGRTFDTVDDFINNSESINADSGLKKSFDDDEKPIVELFRNCVCGSTLMDFFSDRRDFSEKGRKRREIFGKLLELLEKKGLPIEKGRVELLKIMRGEQSETLEKSGIKLTKSVKQ